MKSTGGSVKRARERIQAGTFLSQDEFAQSPENLQATDQKTATPECTSGSSAPGASIPKLTPLLHAKPPTDDDSMRKVNNSPVGENTFGKGSPPQRPPRPSYVPSILTTSQFHHPLPPPSDPSINSSRPSTSSSMGSIPEFPIPSLPLFLSPQQTRRGMNLGPPPSARRGASSYYSQSSYVAPIPEEASESIKNSRSSFASSHLIPVSWTEGEVGDDDEDEEYYGEDGRSSAMTDHDESTGLVRQASLGKRHKPSLTTIKPNDGLDRSIGGSPGEHGHSISKAQTTNSNLLSEFVAELSNAINDDEKSRQFTESDKTSATLKEIEIEGDEEDYYYDSQKEISVEPTIDPTVRQILGGLEKGGAINPGTTPPITSPSLQDISNTMKRPARFEVDEAKDVGFRGSLTSLPDLIRRATKVATNLDKGKTASRLGLFDLLYASEPRVEKGDASSKYISSECSKLKFDRSHFPVDRRSRTGSLTHMLASFPTPGPNMTPTTSSLRDATRWPSRFATNENLVEKSYADSKSEVTSRKPGRRCCGLPLRIFSILMIALIILIAAAVTLPIVFIVLPRQHSQTIATAASSCTTTTLCNNGGISVLSGTTCGCVCANGYSGPSCDQPPTSGCTTINFNSEAPISSHDNATIGSSIPRLLDSAETNFSIPLNSATILSQFSGANLTCDAENALVDFNSKTQRRDAIDPGYAAVRDLENGNGIVIARQTTASSTASSATVVATATSTVGVITSDGIVLAGTSIASTSTTASATITSAILTASASALPSGQVSITQPVLDFSRVVVLYLLQESSIGAAILAQSNLQNVLLGSTFTPGPVALGGNVTADFLHGTVILGNGTTVGGTWSASSPA
jgi:hypothetical protein